MIPMKLFNYHDFLFREFPLSSRWETQFPSGHNSPCIAGFTESFCCKSYWYHAIPTCVALLVRHLALTIFWLKKCPDP